MEQYLYLKTYLIHLASAYWSQGLQAEILAKIHEIACV